MKIAELISKLDYHFNTLAGEVITDHDKVRALRGTQISGIVNDSRKVTENCLFFCINGNAYDQLNDEQKAVVAANAAKAAGDTELRKDCQRRINALNRRYLDLCKASGLKPRRERMYVRGFKMVKV